MQTVCPGPVESNILDYAFARDVKKVRMKNTPPLPYQHSPLGR